MERKLVIEYLIPVQGDEDVAKHNHILSEFYGEEDFVPFKTTDEHLEILIDKLAEAVQKIGDDNGWYVGDGIKVRVELEYEDEEK